MVMLHGYKQTEVGVIPKDWNVNYLNQVCERISVGLASTVTKYYRVSGVPIIRNLNIKDCYFDDSDMLYLEPEFAQKNNTKAAKGYDVLTVHTGSNLGLTCVLPLEYDNCQTFTTLITTPLKNKLDSFFLCYHMSSSLGKSEMQRLQVGGGKGNLNTGDLKKYYFAFPQSIDEQKAIASALSDVDAYIAALEELIAKKRNLKQGAMQELLTGKRRLPGFEGDWVEKPLGELFDFSGGFSASREQLSTVGYPYLHYGDIHGATRTFIDVCTDATIPRLDVSLSRVSNASLLQNGDVVFVDASEDDEGASRHIVIRNRDGKPFISGLHTIVAKAKTDELDNLFREYCFQAEIVRSQFKFYAVGTKVTGVSKTTIAKINLLFPKIKLEQTAIASILSDMDADIDALTSKLEKARHIKQGMMSELLTGRIRLIQGDVDNGKN